MSLQQGREKGAGGRPSHERKATRGAAEKGKGGQPYFFFLPTSALQNACCGCTGEQLQASARRSTLPRSKTASEARRLGSVALILWSGWWEGRRAWRRGRPRLQLLTVPAASSRQARARAPAQSSERGLLWRFRGGRVPFPQEAVLKVCLAVKACLSGWGGEPGEAEK